MSERKAFAVLLMCMLLVLGSMLLPSPALAQSQASTGQLSGVVKDASGAVVPGATITVNNPATGFSQAFTSGEGGLYRAVLLPPGRYKVTVSAKGFADATADEVAVGVGRIAELDFTLSVGARKEQVTVTAEMIEASRHEEAAFVGATVVSNIPLNGGRFQDITNTTPTAAVDGTRGGITIAGQRMVNTGSVNVDGADYGQLFFGGIRGGERAQFAPTIPLSSIQEFQVVRAGYTAEFGRSTGGVITAITKSGTNSFHGGGGYYIRPSGAGMSSEYFDLIKAQLVARGCTTCVVNPNPTLMQWGGDVGGPIKKDKMFFFGSYQQQRQRIPHQIFYSSIATVTPTAVQQDAFNLYKGFEQPFQQTNDAWLFLIKNDWQISNRHHLSTRYNHSNYKGVNAVSVGTGLSPVVTDALGNNGTELDSTRTVMGNLNSYFTHFANELRGQYARETRPRINNAAAPTVGTSIGSYGARSFLPTTEYDYRIQFADNVTWIKGAHTVKFGGEYNHLYAAQLFGFNQFGQYRLFVGTTDILSYMGVPTTPCTPGTTPCGRFDIAQAQYQRQLGNLLVGYSGEQLAGFVQDSWRVRPNFTLNYGLRWEAALNPAPQANNAMVGLVKGFTFPNGRTIDPTQTSNQTHQFGPRLGFAWDPKGNGKTVIRGFGGIYFAATPLLLYSNTVGDFREPPANLSATLPLSVPSGIKVPGCPGPCNTIYDQFQIVGVDLNKYSLNALPILSLDQIQQIAGAILTAQGKAFNKYGSAGPITTANNFHNPRSYQAGFGVEHEMVQHWTVGVEGTWIKTVHLQRDLDFNLPAPPGAGAPTCGSKNPTPCFDVAGRPVYALNSGTTRPIASLGQFAVRDDTAKGLFRALTFRSSVNTRRAQVNMYYTLSENISDDDNERQASGVYYLDPYNFAPDYSYAVADQRHQFVTNPVFFLPWGFDVSSAIRLVSGQPFSALLQTDANQDGGSNDRPYWAPGVPFKRNSFRNRALTFVDFRVQKSITIKESKQVKLSAEFFNVFNVMNLTYPSSSIQGLGSQPIGNYCASAVATCGIAAFKGVTGGWTPNINFRQLYDQDPKSAYYGKVNTNNNAGIPFEAQFSFRFLF